MVRNLAAAVKFYFRKKAMKSAALKKLLVVLFLSFTLCTSGCVYLVVGGIGAVVGYVVSPDAVEGVTSYDTDELWDAVEEVVSVMGTISESKEASGLLIARVNGAKVIITITPIGKSSSKLTVKSRKGFFPKIGISQDIYTKRIT